MTGRRVSERGTVEKSRGAFYREMDMVERDRREGKEGGTMERRMGVEEERGPW